MAVVIIAPNRDVSQWIAAFANAAPDLEVSIWPDVKDHSKIDCAVVWNHPRGCLPSFPNLKLLCSMGAGVDHILSDPELPGDIPITRVIDPNLTFSMSNYVVTAVSYHHRMLEKFVADKQQAKWDPLFPSENPCRVGIFGFGVLGQEAGRKLKALGFEVVGFSGTRKAVAGFECFSGEAELDAFLRKINVLVCLLPATPSTKGILNKQLFAKMNQGTYLINAARGHHQVTADIISGLDDGQLSGAFLDVFETEPLPKDHPAWAHPKIMITPHVASITNPSTVVPNIVADYNAVLNGTAPRNTVDRVKGY